ncbi:hypothetical protein [Streptomyces sp.]|uniref:hypothetical protein n=1 Tax=Streptomyces sp. TaxID=1931 RepID=UPI002D7A06EB|nr:hypothetical protein [Streptomyces sp.]HET6357280.1 hypothetical protein [Streptomyces sp.]
MKNALALEPHANPCWFRLPPGFIDLDPLELDSLRERVLEDLSALHPEPDIREQQSHEALVLLGLLSDVYGQGTMHMSLGLHGSRDLEPSTSVLSLSDVRTKAATRALAAAQCGLRLATDPFGTVVRREIVDLPCGTPATLVTSFLPELPARLGSDAGIPFESSGVFQARLAVARPTGPRVVLINLTTTTIDLSDEYTEILLGVGRTLAFTDPAPPPDSPVGRSRLLDVLL